MDKVDKDPTPDQKKMIERALNESVDAIKDAATTRFENDGVKTAIPLNAEQHWLVRYRPMVTHAVVVLGRDWEVDKKFVIDRAKQVGIVAANMASIRAIILAWIRGEVGQPGQYLHVSSAQMPEITVGMAELASRCVDCVQTEYRDEEQGSKRWDWCSSARSPMNLMGVSSPPTVPEIFQFLLNETVQSGIATAGRLSESLRRSPTS